MNFSNQWPTMPKIGTVDIHSVGNQNYGTGFSVDYQGPRGRITLYVNHYLTDDLNLEFMHRENNQYNIGKGFRIAGDSGEAEQAIRQYVESDGVVERTGKIYVSRPDIWHSYYGAATVESRDNKQALGQLLHFLQHWTNSPRIDAEAGFGLTFRNLAEREIAIREARQEALDGVFAALNEIGGRSTSKAVRESIVRPELKTELNGFTIKPVAPIENLLIPGARTDDGGRYLTATASGRYDSRVHGEPLSIYIDYPSTGELYFKRSESVPPADVTDSDLLVVRGSSILQTMERDMTAFQAIKSNPQIVILSPNGNIEGRLSEFTPAMFAQPAATLKI
jgi:hypothetical protein